MSDQDKAMIELLHIKVNAVVSMSNMILNIVSKAHMKQSAIERVERELKKMNENIGSAATKVELAMTPQAKFWVTNHDAPEASKRVSGPYSTSADAARARSLLERFEQRHNYWIEELDS